jgi:hypothetical protein
MKKIRSMSIDQGAVTRLLFQKTVPMLAACCLQTLDNFGNITSL